MKKEIHITLAEPRGFCAGVDRAIAIVEKALEKYGAPIYVRHEVVHNEFVIENLKRKGAIFVEDMEDIPKGSHVIYSAHGVSKLVRKKASDFNLVPIDATCPLVTKVHKEVIQQNKKGHIIIMIGHEGHPEVDGTMGQVDDNEKTFLVQNLGDIDRLRIKNTEKISYVTQTTLSIDETKEIINKLKTKYPNISGPNKSDICYATQNRQDAIKQILPSSDILFVVGSKNSSNSNRLKELGEKKGIPSILIDDMSDFMLICWDCENEFRAPMAQFVEDKLENGERIQIDPKKGPRLKVYQPPKKSDSLSVDDLIKRDLESTGASVAELEAAVEASKLSGGLMSIEDWIDQTIAAKGYIQAQEHREEFILATGAGATKFNKWMKKAGLYFNKQTGRWTRWEDR